MENVELVLAEDSHLGRAGARVTLALTPTDTFEPSELPNFLAGHRAPGFRADEASPPILVDKDEGKFRIFDKENVFRLVDVERSLNAAVPEVDPKSAVSSYKVKDRFLGSFINDVVDQQSVFNVRQAAMKRIQHAIQLAREVDVWTLLTTSGSWDSSVVTDLGAGYQWNGGASSNPLYDLQKMCEDSSQTITGFFMNQAVANLLLRHSSVRDHMRQMLGDASVADAIGRVNYASAQMVDFVIPGLPPIHVANAKYMSNESTGALSTIIADAVIGLVQPPGVPTDGEDIATTYTFRRRGGQGVGYETREYRVEGRGPKGGTMVVVSMADVPKMTGTTCGGLLLDVIQ